MTAAGVEPWWLEQIAKQSPILVAVVVVGYVMQRVLTYVLDREEKQREQMRAQATEFADRLERIQAASSGVVQSNTRAIQELTSELRTRRT